MNLKFSFYLINFFIHLGVKNFFFSPGARNSPLIYALNKKLKPGLSLISHFDERALGFLSLGYIKQFGERAIILSTSGSAVANFFPAVLEASYSSYPLIVITADRPRDLHNLGNNQTIDQNNFYNIYTKGFINFSSAKDLNFRLYNYQLYNLWDKSKSGPIHINIEFSEPLLDTGMVNISSASYLGKVDKLDKADKANSPFNTFKVVEKSPNDLSKNELAEIKKIDHLINQNKSLLLIVGKMDPFEEKDYLIQLIKKITRITSTMVVLDIASNLVDKLARPIFNNYLINYPDFFFKQNKLKEELKNKVDLIIHLGGVVVNRELLDYLHTSRVNYYHINDSTLPYNPGLTISNKINLSPNSFAYHLLDRILLSKNTSTPNKPTTTWIRTWNHQMEKVLEEHFNAPVKPLADKLNQIKYLDELEACQIVFKKVLRDQDKKKLQLKNLIVGNSNVIRNFNSLISKPIISEKKSTKLNLIVNRGTSGIEGFIATSVGAHLATKKLEPSTWLILGDMSFLYDLNSLALIKQENITNFKIILLNNYEGTIFRHLPINDFFTEAEKKLAYYQHSFSFAATAQQFSFKYWEVEESSCNKKRPKDLLKEALDELGEESQPGLLEVKINPIKNHEYQKKLLQKIEKIIV